MINITDMINITNNTNSTDNPDDNEDDDVIMNVYKIVAIVIFATICVIPCSYYLIIKPLCITPYQNQNISEIEDIFNDNPNKPLNDEIENGEKNNNDNTNSDNTNYDNTNSDTYVQL